MAGSCQGFGGSGLSRLFTPRDIWISSNDTLYVLDGGNYRVQLFNVNQIQGITIISGSYGSSNVSQFIFMDAFTIDFNGNIYIIDSANSRITKWSPRSSNPIIVAGRNRSSPSINQIYSAVGFFLQPQTLFLWISDTGNCRILK
ncbi:hypothetical protein I4U23_016839 [Adineta vaga]|nr:hypothetical protein I4U23_016839 [Adineta vaga]